MFAPCRLHLAPVTVIYICVSGVVRRLAGDGRLPVQEDAQSAQGPWGFHPSDTMPWARKGSITASHLSCTRASVWPHPGASYLTGTSLHVRRWHHRQKLKGDSSKQLREKPRKVQGSQPSATPEGDGASPSNFAGRFSSQLKPRCEVLLDIGR